MNGVTIAQVVVVSEHRHAALPAELAGSLVLAVADALTTLLLKVELAELLLLEDGTVRVCGGIPTDEKSAEQSLRLLLDRVLLSSCSVTPALLRAARRPCQGKVSFLVRELEVALIPTNRGAARRALARLYREVAQAVGQYPNLQKAVEAIRLTDASVPEAVNPEPSAVTEYSVALSVSPVHVTLLEPEPIDEWIEISPVFPEVAAAKAPIDPIRSTIDVYSQINIPDLVVPTTGKQQKQQDESVWQPVEHTQKLTLTRHSKTPIVDIQVAPIPKRKITPPPAIVSAPALVANVVPPPTVTPPPALASEPEVVELSDDDLREVTAELEVSSLAPTSATLDDNSTSNAVEINTPSEAQTAEPFLLVIPTLGQNTDHDTVFAEIAELGFAELLTTEALIPCVDESEDTVLEVSTFVEEEKTGEPAIVGEIVVSEFDSVSEYDLPDVENLSPSGPIVAAIEPPAPVPPQNLGAHCYAAPARFARTPTNVSDRIAQFSVAQIPSSNELTNGLRNLAGVEHEPMTDPSATPPPTVYATEQVGRELPAPTGVFVRTLIGLGTTGLLVLVAQISTGKIAKVSAAATTTPIAVGRSSCRAILKVEDIPLGATVHVSQSGQRPKSEMLQVNQLPFQIDGLSCGEPAELLVKLSNRGWYRIPIEGSRLSGSENSEPVRIATYLKSQ